NRSIDWHEVTLHVGAGTFRPVDKEDVREHRMHQEFITVKRDAIVNLLNNLDHIIAVGTTTVRTLESLYWIGAQILKKMPDHEVFFHVEQWEPYKNEILPEPRASLEALLQYLDMYNIDHIIGNTEIIIVPGYKHQIVKGLITNFHQPKSTLLLLLASFVGDDWKRMYNHALDNGYRFLSYGDSCLIL
ncbi:MAG: S-adenosylmethionine tRNA ribosyltransferase, partial [Salinivirgaceae bacterium]